ncbi:potassium channel family protein [Tabrizicola sp.]|uniref:potassium channel family protein n=1 Tax=Tabrizicola sp. TaxID=2005166 RepID=UPI002FDE9101
MTEARLRSRLRALYEGAGEVGDRFRYLLLAFDLLTVSWLVASSFFPRGAQHGWIDLAIGLVFLADLLARQFISRRPLRELFSFWGLADLLVIVSLLFPIWGEGLAFLRVLRLYRVFHSPQTLDQLRDDIPGFRRNESAVRAALNLVIFIFAMTALVYQTQAGRNHDITNYVDALYFTVTTLSTTGFGDVTLVGTAGKLLSVTIMICGISLFLRLIQVVLRPPKAWFPCPVCGLRRHDHDAVHCKACGTVLNIPDDGLD